MPRKNALLVHQLVTNGDMSADVTSPEVDIQFLDNVAIHANITAGVAPVGELIVEGSGDGGVNYVEVVAVAITADDVFLFDLNQMGFPKVRLRYDRTSGSGTLNVFISSKEV